MRTGDGEAGYAMAALLVALNLMALMMTVALPVWRHLGQREREAELIFRGQQFQRAIALYERRNGPGTVPPDVDTLIQGRFLRKEFKDPITGEDFVLIRQGQDATTTGGTGQPVGISRALGGIVGVASRSEAESIRVYEGQTAYNEWLFVHTGSPTAGNAPGAGRGGRGGRGQPDGVDGGRGRGGRGQLDGFGRGRGGRGEPTGAPDAGRGDARGRPRGLGPP